MKGAGTADGNDIPEAHAAGLERDIDVIVKVLGRLAPPGAAGWHARQHHADNPIQIGAHPDRLVEWILERKQFVRSVGGQHGHVAHGVVIFFGQEAAASQVKLIDLGILGQGGDQPAIVFSVQVAKFLGKDAHRHAPRHGVDGPEKSKVIVAQAIHGDALLRGGVAFRRLDAADDNIGRPEPLDVLERVLHAAFAKSHQGDDGRGADDDAQHGQERTQLMQPQAA